MLGPACKVGWDQFCGCQGSVKCFVERSRTRGRPQTPAEVALRMLLLKHVRNWSYETREREVRGKVVYRSFCRIGTENVPDAKTLVHLRQAIGADTVRALHDRIVALARRWRNGCAAWCGKPRRGSSRESRSCRASWSACSNRARKSSARGRRGNRTSLASWCRCRKRRTRWSRTRRRSRSDRVTVIGCRQRGKRSAGSWAECRTGSPPMPVSTPRYKKKGCRPWE